jgi:hypothetical protein
LHRSRFFTLYFDRRVGEIPPLIRKVLPIIEAQGTPSHRYFLYQSMAMGAMAGGGYRYSEEAVKLAHKAVAQVEGDPRYVKDWYDGRFTIGMVHLMGGLVECAEAAVVFEGVASDVERLGDALLLSRVLTYLAITHRRLGRTEEAERVARSALRAAEAAKQWQYIGAARACLAWAAGKKGDRRAAATTARTALEAWRNTVHDFPFHWLASLVLVDVARAEGEGFEQAAGLLADLLARGQQTFPAPIQEALAAAAQACREREPRDTEDAVDAFLVLAARAGYI